MFSFSTKTRTEMFYATHFFASSITLSSFLLTSYLYVSYSILQAVSIWQWTMNSFIIQRSGENRQTYCVLLDLRTWHNWKRNGRSIKLLRLGLVKPSLLSDFQQLIYFLILSSFLPRDAMHKRGLCRHAVSLCLCICLSLCLSRSWIMSKRINISSKVFYHRVVPPF